MVDCYLKVSGSSRLSGVVRVNGAKNAILPMVMASLLTKEEVRYTNVPEIKDILLAKSLIENIGGTLNFEKSCIKVKTGDITSSAPSSSIIKSFRGSIWVLGPLLARTGKAKISLPGGDIIGKRPVDIHLSGLEAMGAEILFENSMIVANARGGLHPVDFDLGFPSVGATHQLLMAAALVEGESIFRNVAREPEVEALCDLLVQMGAEITREESLIKITGKKELSGAKVKLIGDRIEAGTFILAAAMTGGELIVEGFNPQHLGGFLNILQEMGVKYIIKSDAMIVEACEKLKAVSVETKPFPGFATDIQPQLTAALSIAEGTSYIKENLYESRFTHAYELNKMGAKISIENEGELGSVACIKGVSRLKAAKVSGLDIRAAAAMLIAGLVAEGETHLYECWHLNRGYYNYQQQYTSLGAELELHNVQQGQEMFIGC